MILCTMNKLAVTTLFSGGARKQCFCKENVVYIKLVQRLFEEIAATQYGEGNDVINTRFRFSPEDEIYFAVLLYGFMPVYS